FACRFLDRTAARSTAHSHIHQRHIFAQPVEPIHPKQQHTTIPLNHPVIIITIITTAQARVAYRVSLRWVVSRSHGVRIHEHFLVQVVPLLQHTTAHTLHPLTNPSTPSLLQFPAIIHCFLG